MRTAPTPPHTLTSACSTGAQTQSPHHTVHHTHTAPAASSDCSDVAQPFHAPNTRTAGSSVDAANIAPRAHPTLHPTPTTRASTTEPHVTYVLCMRRGTTPPSSSSETRPPPTRATASTSTQRQTRTRTLPPTTKDRRHRSPDAKPRITMGQVSQDIQQEWKLCRTELVVSTFTPANKIVISYYGDYYLFVLSRLCTSRLTRTQASPVG